MELIIKELASLGATPMEVALFFTNIWLIGYVAITFRTRQSFRYDISSEIDQTMSYLREKEEEELDKVSENYANRYTNFIEKIEESVKGTVDTNTEKISEMSIEIENITKALEGIEDLVATNTQQQKRINELTSRLTNKGKQMKRLEDA